MPRMRRASFVPKTPGGLHLKMNEVSADEIVVDDEITVKSSFYGGKPRTTSKFIVRKSTDLKKIKKIDDRIEAILASPMIEVRRRPSGQAKSLDENKARSPLWVPSSKDPVAVSNRRMSAHIISKFAPYASSNSFTEGNRPSVCPRDIKRRMTMGYSESSWNPSSPAGISSPKYNNTPVTPAPALAKKRAKVPTSLDVDECGDENSPPQDESLAEAVRVIEQSEPATRSPVEASQPTPASSDEPASVNEFRVLVQMEENRLSLAKTAWEDVLAEEGESIPEKAVSSIRAAIGKCGLLLNKKFTFFKSLIDFTEGSLRQQQHCEGDSGGLTPQQRATLNDLLGMWTIITQQIADIDKTFDRLRVWREVSGWGLTSPPSTPAPLAPSASRKKIGSSRLPLPVSGFNAKTRIEPKGTLKRLIPSSQNPSKLRPAKLGQPSKFAQFKAQMLAKRRAAAEEGVENTSKSPAAADSPGDFVLSLPKKHGRLSKSPSVAEFPLTTDFTTEGDTKITPKGRGRPSELQSSPVQLLGEVVNETPKSRDGPRKSIDSLVASSVSATPKRRGRPSKVPNPVGHSVLESSVEPMVTEVVETPRSRGRPRKSVLPQLAPAAAATTPRSRGRPRKSVASSSITPATAANLLSPKRGRPSKVASAARQAMLTSPLASPRRGRPPKVLETPVNAFANLTTGDSFAVPSARAPRRTATKRSIAPTSSANISTASSSASLFSPMLPQRRPPTGTPLPHPSRKLRATPDPSLSGEQLSKKLLLAVTKSASSMLATPPARSRRTVHFPPPSSLASTPNGHPVMGESSKPLLPVTPHVSVSTDPSRRVSQRGKCGRPSKTTPKQNE